MKTCAHCGPVKGPLPDSAFHRHAHHADGLASVCKDCRAEYRRQYRAANAKRLAAEDLAYRAALAAEVFSHYGTSCRCCGSEDDLTVDHELPGGNQHRRDLFGPETASSGYQFHLWLRREGFPPGYQAMCRPCNSSKGGTLACRLHVQAEPA